MRLTKIALFLAALVLAAPAFAQFEGIKVEIFDGGSEDEKGGYKMGTSLSDPVEVEAKPGKRNFWWRISWTKPLAANYEAKVEVLTSGGSYQDGVDPRYLPQGLSKIEYPMSVPKGSYVIQLVDKNDSSKVFVKREFKVVDKTEAESGDLKAGPSEFFICKTVNDDWSPAGAAEGDQKKKEFSWPADQPFEILIKNNHKPFGCDFLGIVIHKQGDDGKDVSFVTEFQTDMIDDKKTTMWCTQGGLPNYKTLEPGKYTFYVISWSDRQATEHTGNLTKYFAKATVIVKAG